MGNINNPGGTHVYGMFTSPNITGDNPQLAGCLYSEPIAKNVDYSTATTATALNIPNQVEGLLVSGLTFMKINQMLNGQPIFERKSDEGALFGAGVNTPVIERIQYCQSVQGPGQWVLLNDTYMDNGILQCCGGNFDCSKSTGGGTHGGHGETPMYAWAEEPGTDNLNTMVTKGLKGGLGDTADGTLRPVGVQPYYSDRKTHTKNATPQGGGE